MKVEEKWKLLQEVWKNLSLNNTSDQNKYISTMFNYVIVLLVALALNDLAKYYINRSIKFQNGTHKLFLQIRVRNYCFSHFIGIIEVYIVYKRSKIHISAYMYYFYYVYFYYVYLLLILVKYQKIFVMQRLRVYHTVVL